MTIPQFLRATVHDAISKVKMSNAHDYLPIARKSLVEDWLAGNHSLSQAQDAYRFCSILVATKTLGIYDARRKGEWTNNWYHNEMPKRFIEIAKACVTKEVPVETATELTQKHFVLIGDMGEDMGIRASLALKCADSALRVSAKSRLGDEFDIFDKKSSLIDPSINNSNWLALFTEGGDTAAIASVAWSCSEDSDEGYYDIDPQKNLEFWLWYFDEAIPTAWSMAGYKE